MKKTYTKKQITEAIAYWKKQLKTMNESIHTDYIIRIGDQTYNLVNPENREKTVFGYAAESPYVQIYVNADDSVQCVVYADDAANEQYAFTVEGLSGRTVREKNLHRTQMNVVKRPQ